MSKNVIVYIEPENVSAATGAAVLDVCERTFHELVRRGDITKIQIPGMRRTTFSLRQIRELAARWRGENVAIQATPVSAPKAISRGNQKWELRRGDRRDGDVDVGGNREGAAGGAGTSPTAAWGALRTLGDSGNRLHAHCSADVRGSGAVGGGYRDAGHLVERRGTVRHQRSPLPELQGGQAGT
jgi:hypothetical protein